MHYYAVIKAILKKIKVISKREHRRLFKSEFLNMTMQSNRDKCTIIRAWHLLFPGKDLETFLNPFSKNPQKGFGVAYILTQMQ